MVQWKYRRNEYMILAAITLIVILSLLPGSIAKEMSKKENYFDKELMNYVDELLSVDKMSIMPGFQIELKENVSTEEGHKSKCDNPRNLQDVTDYFNEKWNQYIESHVLAVNVSETSRLLKGK